MNTIIFYLNRFEGFCEVDPVGIESQAFLRIKSVNAAYMLGSQLCLQLVFAEYI